MIRYELKNIPDIYFQSNSSSYLEKFVKNKRDILVISDIFFKDSNNQCFEAYWEFLNSKNSDFFYYDSKSEPSVGEVDNFINNNNKKYDCIIGIGGGSTLDFSKAVSNMMCNSGSASKYQGWDLLKKNGVFKVGIPTISGTGAESTRTCVLIDKKTNKKLGINSEYSVYDGLILDPEYTLTVPYNQLFYTAMDTYIHSIESLNGHYRNTLGDAFSKQSLGLIINGIKNEDWRSLKSRQDIMSASYIGGLGISMSYVGLIHPLSAALSVVYDLHHCVANCIVMRAMKNYYPKEYDFFWELADEKKIVIPKNVCKNLSNNINKLMESTLIHEIPLKNALGENYISELTKDKFYDLFAEM